MGTLGNQQPREYHRVDLEASWVTASASPKNLASA